MAGSEPILVLQESAALEAVLSNTPVPAEQRPSMGCNVKWKPGNEPAYYS